MAQCSLLHNGVAATSSFKVVVCVPPSSDRGSTDTSQIVYASHAMLNVARQTKVTVHAPITKTETDTIVKRKPIQENIWNAYKSLRTRTTAPSSATNTTSATASPSTRIITSVGLLRRATAQSDSTQVLISAFSDGSITSWYRDAQRHEEGTWTERLLLPETEDDYENMTNSLVGRSVTDVDGCSIDKKGERLFVATCTSAGAEIFDFKLTQNDGLKANKLLARHSLISTPANSVRLHPITKKNGKNSNSDWLILVGTAAPRHNKIHVFLLDSAVESKPIFKPLYCGSLTGHEDWITCFDWFSIAGLNGSDMLASGSQDARIRLWKFASSLANDTESTILLQEPEDASLKQDLGDDQGDDDEDEEEEEEEGESRLEILHDNNQMLTSVTLEALLIGHEEHVTSVRWHPNPQNVYRQDLILISSSMDRTIFIWGEHDSGVWAPISRVGSAGGILGGSIGSSLLGFMNALVEPVHGSWLLGHAYGGALHFFSREFDEIRPLQENNTSSTHEITMSIEERAALIRWRAQPCLTGHFAGVTDLSWEANEGAYLLTVSHDQTCRLWVPIQSTESRGKESWIELARPQVHGYNLSAVASLSTCDRPHMIVSGADEKELRAFDATKAFLRQFSLLYPGGEEIVSKIASGVERVERAYIPSLGLTTKASAADGADEDAGGPSESHTLLPLERDLGAVSLWPEVRKLYGHNTELTRLASTASAAAGNSLFDSSPYAKDVMVASSAKARTVDDACIRLWNVKDSRCIQVLAGGHKSTVAALAFSPDGRYLASTGKDRRLCIWRRSEEPRPLVAGGPETNPFFLAAAADTAHKRIVWSVHFCPFEPTWLASGARDGTIKIWKIQDIVVEDRVDVAMKEIFVFSPRSKSLASKAESVTSLSFGPLPMPGHPERAILALGLENGLIELWSIHVVEEGAPPEILLCVPPDLCHISTVTKLAWRPLGRPPSKEKQNEFVLASCSMDHACRIYNVSLGSI